MNLHGIVGNVWFLGFLLSFLVFILDSTGYLFITDEMVASVISVFLSSILVGLFSAKMKLELPNKKIWKIAWISLLITLAYFSISMIGFIDRNDWLSLSWLPFVILATILLEILYFFLKYLITKKTYIYFK